MGIREFRLGDEPALFAVYYSAIHRVACADYTPEQLEAWAPATLDPQLWARRMQEIRPFVAEDQNEILGYADVQANGYIDHFFVSGFHPRRGIGTLLMNRIYEAAHERDISTLTSDVSRTAQPFYERFGFVVVERRTPVVRGVVVPNAFMRKEFISNSSLQRTTSGSR